MFNMYTLYLLITLNISIQTIDCNNLQNSYVLRILCFWGEGDCLGDCLGDIEDSHTNRQCFYLRSQNFMTQALFRLSTVLPKHQLFRLRIVSPTRIPRIR
jgi:hypothetical protein